MDICVLYLTVEWPSPIPRSSHQRPNGEIWGVGGGANSIDSRYISLLYMIRSLHWRHNGRDRVSNHQPHDCLLIKYSDEDKKKTSKLRVTGTCAGNSSVTGEFPAQMASKAENVSIWWRHHVMHVHSTTITMITFAFTKDFPNLALTGELWGVFRELYEEKWHRYIERARYSVMYLYPNEPKNDSNVLSGYNDVLCLPNVINAII